MLRQVGKSHVVKFMKSSLPEVNIPYRKPEYNYQKWSYCVNGGGGGGGNVVESSRLDTG